MLAGSTSWPDAAIAMVGIGLVAVFVLAAVVVIWQLFVSYRARAALAREEVYQKLAEETGRAQSSVAEQLESMRAELRDVRDRTVELERILKEVG